jgi:hypothetical protein
MKAKYKGRVLVHPLELEGKGFENKLRPGLQVVLYEPGDIEVEAILEFDEEMQMWFGVPDWSTNRVQQD